MRVSRTRSRLAPARYWQSGASGAGSINWPAECNAWATSLRPNRSGGVGQLSSDNLVCFYPRMTISLIEDLMRRFGFVLLAVVLSWEVHILREASVVWAIQVFRGRATK